MYLDAAATAPLRPEARAAMERVWDAGQANASSLHAAGAAAHRELEYARETVAATFGVAPEGVVFTSGGTESNNRRLRSGAGAPTRAPDCDDAH